MDATVSRVFSRRPRPDLPPPRISAWLADVDDWDADDADIFMAQVGREERLVSAEEEQELSA